MIHSSRRDRKAKAIAEVLAMIADAYPPLAPHRPRPVLETEEWLFESATVSRLWKNICRAGYANKEKEPLIRGMKQQAMTERLGIAKGRLTSLVRSRGALTPPV